ncbi:MAG: tRNA (adenosine(37)-N6)-threonylcarbamoyltransferase complex ATPase subunit type 1 TsaE [Methyloligellaceae bacterium]
MTSSWVFENVDLDELKAIAERLSVFLQVGDVLLLNGSLGAGKTTFARFILRALHPSGPDLQVPSPTFSIMQNYATASFEIHHFDFFRLESANEIRELDLETSIEDGVCLIEWPERARELLPADRLNIEIEDGTGDEQRTIKLRGEGCWGQKLARIQEIWRFVETTQWQSSVWRYLQGDASTRRYIRLESPAHPALMVDSPARSDGPVIKHGMTYSQIAHLAEDAGAFIAISGYLTSIGIRAPQVLANDLSKGLFIVEDLGKEVYSRLISANKPIEPLYRAALDVLLGLGRHQVPESLPVAKTGEQYTIPVYDTPALTVEVELFLEWHLKLRKDLEISENHEDKFISVWQELFGSLEHEKNHLVLRDFHSPNLIFLDDRKSASSVGVIDFQDGVRGPEAYDVVSLLQDARVDIPQDIESRLLDYYCAQRRSDDCTFDEKQFRRQYALLGAQRNTKILGIFARLAIRDSKPQYLKHIPRIWGYLERNLSNDYLCDLKHWYDHAIHPENRC